MSNQREIIEIPARIAEAQARTEKLRVAAYCRVSTNPGGPAEQLSGTEGILS